VTVQDKYKTKSLNS